MQERLIGALLRAALEQAGTERGLLILWRNNEPRIAAEATRREDTVIVTFCNEIVTDLLLPMLVLKYVEHTRNCVVIDDSTGPTTFAMDPYVRRHKGGTIICLPLLSQAELLGILFLENNLASGVFAPAQITVLTLVSSLAGIALDYSRLYSDLQSRESKIRRLVDAGIIGIYIIDLEGQIIEANDVFLRMLGYEREDLISGRLRWTDMTPPEWRTADEQRRENVKRTGRLQPFEKEYFHKDGTRVPVLVGVARFEETQNQAVVFALDMSEQKRAEAIASGARRALEARVNEYTRTARELPDTLLQNFLGLMYQFQAVRNMMPRHPDEALRSLDEAINDGKKALDESRDAIEHLGSAPYPKGILPE